MKGHSAKDSFTITWFIEVPAIGDPNHYSNFPLAPDQSPDRQISWVNNQIRDHRLLRRSANEAHRVAEANVDFAHRRPRLDFDIDALDNCADSACACYIRSTDHLNNFRKLASHLVTGAAFLTFFTSPSYARYPEGVYWKHIVLLSLSSVNSEGDPSVQQWQHTTTHQIHRL